MELKSKEAKYTEPTLSEIIGSIIADLRIQKGLSQKEFGKLFNLSDSAISHYETGRDMISIILLCQIADKFNISLDYLAGRLSVKAPYDMLNHKIDDDMTLAEIANCIDKFPKQQQKYISDTIKMVRENIELKKE